ncbi:DUF1599 domain-containing protein [Roseivirga sp. BDSF3-8]|uniref:DUF1599 domain-containing protein n=1 Tax=Roseivirga sp. BDSF3-8 TaxID=3241598 RepID=UPI0035324C61
MVGQTVSEYKEVISSCKELFEKKTSDYGTASWRILRLPSVTDLIFIKANRVRSIQEKGKQKVADNVQGEFMAIINYCLIAMMQLQLEGDTRLELPVAEAIDLYNKAAEDTLELLSNKNHDYGEAWRDMRVSSITDIILMKLLRIKQIEDNQGKTIVSEGVRANYQDMLNYAVFALIQMKDEKE